MPEGAPRVLIVTDSLLSVKEPSVLGALRKQWHVHRSSAGAWLDLRLKILTLERVLTARAWGRTPAGRRADPDGTVRDLLSGDINLGAPELTEVLLMTLLDREGIGYEAVTYAELAADTGLQDRLLGGTDAVFASSTMLRGLPELATVAKLCKRPHNRLVVGGALVGALHGRWPGVEGIDLVAIGYGEWLVPSIVTWLRTGELVPPERGRIVEKAGTTLLYSGVPIGKNLDDLARPDWALAEAYHGRAFPMVHYESVRGCPYRCQFCNYPFLFDDTKFRYKSAERIADDWTAYAEGGARLINCLDSLFTVPRKRLMALCDHLIERDLGLGWVCYARADDLVKPGTVEKMKRAGCIQVQIGIESGDAQILKNMDKRCSVETNLEAMRRCAEGGISTLVSVIVGFPGETEDSIERTLDHLRAGQPDFYYCAPFSVELDHIPIMSPESQQKYGLRANSEESSIRYWRHDTMDCAETVAHVERFNRAMMTEGVAAEASLFYPAIPQYRRSEHRERVLAYQRGAAQGLPWVRSAWGAVSTWAQRRLERDMADAFDRRLVELADAR